MWKVNREGNFLSLEDPAAQLRASRCASHIPYLYTCLTVQGHWDEAAMPTSRCLQEQGRDVEELGLGPSNLSVAR